MKKIAIRFSLDEKHDSDEVKFIAQHLQRFIIEDDYSIKTISSKMLNNTRIELDIGMEENMPEFSEFTEELDELEIEYELYKPTNGDWDSCEIDDLELDRTPEWINSLVGLNVLWYSVMTVLQFFFIYDWYSEKYEWSGIVSTIAAFFTALVPIFGSLVAYWSVTELGDWESYKALWAFFVYYVPLLGFILYLVWVIVKALYSDRWYRFWRSEFN
jgi:hypothetical protein